jgi:hypothetical protein
MFLDDHKNPCTIEKASICQWYWPDEAVPECQSTSKNYTSGSKQVCDKNPTPPSILPGLYQARFHPLSVVDSDGRNNWQTYYQNGDKFGLKIDWLDEKGLTPTLLVNGMPVPWKYQNFIASVQKGWNSVKYHFAYVSVDFGKSVEVKFDDVSASVYIPNKGEISNKAGLMHSGDPCPDGYSCCDKAFQHLNNSFNSFKDNVAVMTIGGDIAYSSTDPANLIKWFKGTDSKNGTQADPKFNQLLSIAVMGNHDYDTMSPTGSTPGKGPNDRILTLSANNVADGGCGVFQMTGMDGLKQPLLTNDIAFPGVPCVKNQVMNVEYTLGFYAVGRYGFVTWDNFMGLSAVRQDWLQQAAVYFKQLKVDTLFVISHFDEKDGAAQNNAKDAFAAFSPFFPDIPFKKYISNHRHENFRQEPDGYILGGGGWVGGANTHPSCDPIGTSYAFFDASIPLDSTSNPRLNSGW